MGRLKILTLVIFASSVSLFLLLFPKESVAQTFDCDSGFQQVANGVQYRGFTATSPRTLAWWVVKTDLNTSGITTFVTPESGLGTTTSQFLQNYGLQVAVNGDAFNVTSNPLGYAASEGVVYSPRSGEPPIFMDQSNNVTFRGQTPSSPWNAISGVHTIVVDGEASPDKFPCGAGSDPVYCSNLEPRTAVGITGTNTMLFIVVDGRRPSYSNGVTLEELANMMTQCNAFDAINMDGGSSSTLSIAGVGTVNSPSGGAEREVSNHLGISAHGGPGITPIPPLPPPLPPSTSVFEPRPRYTILQPYPFPCNRVAPENSNPIPFWSDLEFHSLRPYQASPCNPNLEDIALFCGTDLVIPEPVTVSYDYLNPPPFVPSCSMQDRSTWSGSPYPACCEYTESDNSRARCRYLITGTREVALDLTDTEFPIMGYTEPSVGNESDPFKVTNSINATQDETVDHPAKVNEYVSWYLNGVIGRAEYSQLDAQSNCIGETTSIAGECKYSSPDNCNQIRIPFLPPIPNPGHDFDGQDGCPQETLCCINTGGNGTQTLGRDILINFSGPIKKLLPLSIQNTTRNREIRRANQSRYSNAGIRHDQVAACIYGIGFRIPILNTDVVFGGIPAPCYESGFLNGILNLFGGRPRLRLSDWLRNHRLPPIEQEPPYNAELYSQFIDDYLTWRGNYCVAINIPFPIIGNMTFVLCFDNPFNPNYWSSLFPNVHLSSTEDRLGNAELTVSPHDQPDYSDFRLLSATLTGDTISPLYFAHMQESEDLSGILQETYSPYGANLIEVTDPGQSFSSEYCQYTTVRTNPGDKLFGGEIRATLDYTAQVTARGLYTGIPPSGVWCERLGGECVSGAGLCCNTCYTQLDCPAGNFCGRSCEPPDPTDPLCLTGCSGPGQRGPVQSRDVVIYINLPIDTRTPLADNVWTRLVTGTSGVFRRLFPKVGPGGAVTTLWDIPTSTDIYYTGEGQAYFGNPDNQMATGSLYFPHIGGIKEYFLTGIQTLLRPKGYGSQILADPNANPLPDTTSTGSCPLGTGLCDASNLTLFGTQAPNASQICNWESGGDPLIINRSCLICDDGQDNDGDGVVDYNDSDCDGASADYSVGLFQINLHPRTGRCPGAWYDTTGMPYEWCRVANAGILQNCVSQYQQADYNIQRAFQIANCYADTSGTMQCNWCPWGAARSEACNIATGCP